MSKKDSANTVVKEKEKKITEDINLSNWKEVRENVTLQLKNHLEQINVKEKEIEYHKTMANKAQGAIEVGDQMHPEDIEQEETK